MHSRMRLRLFIGLLVMSTLVQPSLTSADQAQSETSADYAPTGCSSAFASLRRSKGRQRALDSIHGTVIQEYALAPGVALVQLDQRTGIDVPAAQAMLQKDPAVNYAEPDYWITPLDAIPDDPRLGEVWGLANANAPSAWVHHTGTNDMVVAVIDMGVDYYHPDLADNIWINPDEIAGNGIDDDANGYVDDIRGYDFYYHDNDPMDAGTHGTHVAGTICAEGNNGIGVVGMLWRCQIMVLQFMGPTGGFTSGAMDALSYAVDKGVRVSNNSWGTNSFSTPLYTVIQNTQAIGHVVVAAAGNNGRDTDLVPLYPASFNLDNIISVGSIQSNEAAGQQLKLWCGQRRSAHARSWHPEHHGRRRLRHDERHIDGVAPRDRRCGPAAERRSRANLPGGPRPAAAIGPPGARSGRPVRDRRRAGYRRCFRPDARVYATAGQPVRSRSAGAVLHHSLPGVG